LSFALGRRLFRRFNVYAHLPTWERHRMNDEFYLTIAGVELAASKRSDPI
jgi:hypothetical protein